MLNLYQNYKDISLEAVITDIDKDVHTFYVKDPFFKEKSYIQCILRLNDIYNINDLKVDKKYHLKGLGIIINDMIVRIYVTEIYEIMGGI